MPAYVYLKGAQQVRRWLGCSAVICTLIAWLSCLWAIKKLILVLRVLLSNFALQHCFGLRGLELCFFVAGLMLSFFYLLVFLFE